MRRTRFLLALVLIDRRAGPALGAFAEPRRTVRIGLKQSAATVSLRAATAFTVQQNQHSDRKIHDGSRAGSCSQRTSLRVPACSTGRLSNWMAAELIVLPRGTKIADRRRFDRPSNSTIEVTAEGRSIWKFPKHVYRRQRTAARRISVGSRSERIESDDVRRTRSAEGAGRRCADVHHAQHGAVQE